MNRMQMIQVEVAHRDALARALGNYFSFSAGEAICVLDAKSVDEDHRSRIAIGIA